MTAKYKGKSVKITKLITVKREFVTHPILVQVRIEWKEKGDIKSDYVDANQIEF
jgi:hypothetical protein